MDNDEIEKYKREVEQNQMRGQGLLIRWIFFIKKKKRLFLSIQH
jgi:hypothetical protein